jgi:hypothetical protein
MVGIYPGLFGGEYGSVLILFLSNRLVAVEMGGGTRPRLRPLEELVGVESVAEKFPGWFRRAFKISLGSGLLVLDVNSATGSADEWTGQPAVATSRVGQLI